MEIIDKFVSYQKAIKSEIMKAITIITVIGLVGLIYSLCATPFENEKSAVKKHISGAHDKSFSKNANTKMDNKTFKHRHVKPCQE
jgi:hypothetical protein